jgi:plastocyanin
VVDAKTKGVRDVYVFIRQPAGIHPSLPKDAASAGAAFDAEFQKANGFPRKELTSKLKGGTKANTVKAPMLVDQVFCKYVPHAAAIQEGQPLLVLNPEPVAHNIKLTSQSGSNDFNITMPVNSAEQLTLKAEAGAIAMGCTIHPWMVGSLMVFDHPYFAVTKADGSFEIKNAPAGDNNLVIVVPGGVGAVDASSGGKGSARGSKITVPANGEAGIGQGGELKVRK